MNHLTAALVYAGGALMYAGGIYFCLEKVGHHLVAHALQVENQKIWLFDIEHEDIDAERRGAFEEDRDQGRTAAESKEEERTTEILP